MFDLGAAELLVIAIVAVLVIGPKDMPLALRTAGRWIGKVRRVSGHFRAGLDTMIREAELEEIESKWKAQNEAIMAKSQGAAAEAAVPGEGFGEEPDEGFDDGLGEGADDRPDDGNKSEDTAPEEGSAPDDERAPSDDGANPVIVPSPKFPGEEA